MTATRYLALAGGTPRYYALLTVLGALVLAGLFAAHHMDSQGHHVTGMSNSIVWGMPHVCAIFLIVAASGALNVASLASVFGRAVYKPLSRLSGLVAIALLSGGLVILVLDLGRPDRLVVAMTHYNFKSIFAWNIFLYTGFIGIVGVYLWLLFERRFNKYSTPVGFVAFFWRLILTTGTGSIFGFIVARQGYDAAILAPMFVVMSFSFGTAAFIAVLMVSGKWTGRALGRAVRTRLARLQGIFVAAVGYFVLVQHLTSFYTAEHQAFERFILLDGGVYPALFWGAQIVLGMLVPLVLLFLPQCRQSGRALALAVGLILLGGIAQLYVIVVGGQAFPLVMFPGMEIIGPSVEGVVATYVPSLAELSLGTGGAAFAAMLIVVAMRVLPFLPESLADAL